MRRQDFAYELPAELIAQSPLPDRSASRMLVLDGTSGVLVDRTIRDLPSLLRPADLLVFNDTRVVAARVHGVKASGGRVEVFLERALSGSRAWVQLRASKPIRDGLEISTTGGLLRVVTRRDDLWEVETPGDALTFFERWGEVPLPPYIHRDVEASDRERYQSIFAREPGAVAAPTASLHFDAGLLDALAQRAVRHAFVTLHVGAGTFQPVRVEDLEAHVMHAERLDVGADVIAAITQARREGGRVIAVGTTVVRALETAANRSLALGGDVPGDNASAVQRNVGLEPFSGESRLFIRPGFRFRVVDAMLTNFHLPESTLLMLVSAFAGRERVLAAYSHAVRQRYRFFSYGDAMFVTPTPAAVEPRSVPSPSPSSSPPSPGMHA